MKKLMTLIALLTLNLMVYAQKEFRFAKSSGQLNLRLNAAIIEGYDGREIIFSSQNSSNQKIDERAKGLVAITSSGYVDNTGLGVNIKENGQELSVNNVSSGPSDLLTIKVPQGVKVTFTNNESQYFGDVIIKNIKGEVEVSTRYNNIKLENNSGPMNIATVQGTIDAIFDKGIKGPISMVSIYDYIDLTLPSNIAADMELATNYGKLYSAKEIKIIKDVKELTTGGLKPTLNTLSATINKANVNKVTGTKGKGTTIFPDNGSVAMGTAFNLGDRIKGSINGGGIAIILKSTNGNIYLRQQ